MQENAAAITRPAEGTQRRASPADNALQAADRSTILAFAYRLDPLELRVFVLVADGMSYRAIATRLDLPVHVVRQAHRSFERKRQRFPRSLLSSVDS